MKPFVSIISVNYNGKSLLKGFLSSVEKLNYPKDFYEVIVVDNNSTDNSVGFIKDNFKWVKIIKSPRNVGFGMGNNLGIKEARGDLVYLVNNDTELESNSLKNIVDCYEHWSKREKVGAINSKLLLFDDYVHLEIKEALFSDAEVMDTAKPKNKEIYFISYSKDQQYGENIYIPYKKGFDGPLIIDLSFNKYRGGSGGLVLGNKVRDIKFGSDTKVNVSLILSKEELGKTRKIFIQNAGNVLFRDGHSRDRGAAIIYNKQYYEPDEGQYNKEEKIPSFCGAAVLINKRAINKVGGFDKNYFMYYEDIDLSLRMKSEGYKVLYCPRSVVRHIHSGTSKEWSPMFVFNAERGRLLTVMRHWPLLFVVKEWIRYAIRDTIMVSVFQFISGAREKALAQFNIRMRVVRSLVFVGFVSLFRTRRLSNREIKEFV